MSDLISKEKLKDYLERNISFGGVEKKFAFFDIIDSIPSADILECAMALKEYCNNTRCENCEFDTSGWLCRVAQAMPSCWDLPEGGGRRT